MHVVPITYTSRNANYQLREMGVEIEYDHESPPTVTQAVIEAVSQLTDTDPQKLPPLYDTVDPTAVDRLFSHNGTQELQLYFHYHDLEITVASNGTIVLEERG